MTGKEILEQLRKLGDEKMRAIYAKQGAGENHYGVKMGDIRALAKQIKTDHDLGQELWSSGNVDAMFLATLIMKPKLLTPQQLEDMLSGLTFPNLVDWFGTNIVKQHPAKEELRERWMESSHPVVARMGWSLTTERVLKSPQGLDLSSLLDRLESEMPSAPEVTRWTMNFCLGEIGINFPEHRDRAVAIGNKIGAYRDYPVSKGCVSPYVPTWVAEMVSRQAAGK